MASINLNFYKKSYMLEFMKNGTVTDVFTFSVPPESEQFDFSQRVVETKTFGGSVFENFGNDTIRITLSGSTGNGEAKLIYRGVGKTPKYLTGENEIWHLQELLQEWHDVSSSDTSTEKKIYLYDLSKMSTFELAAMSPSRNWWRVIVKNFQIKRQVSKPIYYNYTLELLGLVEEPHAEESFLKSIADTVNDIAETIDTVNEYVQGTADAISLVNEAIDTVKDIYDQLENADDTSSVLLAFSSGVDTVNRAVNVNTNASFYSSTQSTLSAASTLNSTIKDIVDEMLDEMFDDDDDDDEELSDGTYTAAYSGSGDELEEVKVAVKSGSVTVVTVGGTACTASGSAWVYTASDGTVYNVTISIGSSSVKYSYTVQSTSDSEDTSDTDDTTDTGGSTDSGDSSDTDDTGSDTGDTSSGTDMDTDGDSSGDDDTTGSTDGDSTDTGDTDSNTDTDTDSSGSGDSADDTDTGSDTDGSDTSDSTDTSGSAGSDSGDDDTTDTGDDSTDTSDTGSTGDDDSTDTDTDGDSTGSGDDDTDTGSDTGSSTLADGTYTASYTGDADELGDVVVTVESGSVVAVSVGSSECTASEGVWLYVADASTVYAITLATGTGLVTYTYETVFSTDE